MVRLAERVTKFSNYFVNSVASPRRKRKGAESLVGVKTVAEIGQAT
jgi:hypothetical protein